MITHLLVTIWTWLLKPVTCHGDTLFRHYGYINFWILFFQWTFGIVLTTSLLFTMVTILLVTMATYIYIYWSLWQHLFIILLLFQWPVGMALMMILSLLFNMVTHLLVTKATFISVTMATWIYYFTLFSGLLGWPWRWACYLSWLHINI